MRLDPPLEIGDRLVDSVNVRQNRDGQWNVYPNQGKKRKKNGDWYQDSQFISVSDHVVVPPELVPDILDQWAAEGYKLAIRYAEKAEYERENALAVEAEAARLRGLS